MIQDRKEYRKSFTSNGSIYLGGEKLYFKGYDISVRGMQIELTQGTLVQNVSDVAQIIESNSTAEIYVDELRLTGEVELIWVREDEEKILIGLEFRDVMHNAEKLWRKRRFYRKKLVKTGSLILQDQEIDFECLDFSIDGMRLRVAEQNNEIVKAGAEAKIVSDQLGLEALAKIVWVNRNEDDEIIYSGLRYLEINE
jgi:c-di-GMP-binding flagellar brake protein YcgR